MQAHTIHKTYRQSLLQLADTMSSYSFLTKEEYELRAIADNLQSPFNIAVFGRMKTGKSTLINALIGKQLAITGVEEATATINRITYATGERLNQFTVHWQDAQPEQFPLEKLRQDWNGKSPEVLERIAQTAWLELYSDAPSLRNIHITDTPGTGSNADEHERVAKQFINGQEADALLYVFSPTGRESDEADLEAFRKGCLPGSSLDNSVAVLHKWDHIFWDEDDWDSIRKKASRVQNFLKDLVSAVIPVSAPLALLAKTAPAEFWEKCHAVLSTFSSEKALRNTLADDEEWEDDIAREKLYNEAKALGCPLSSFRVMMRHLYRHPGENAADIIYQLSGLQQLETVLDRQIFSMRSVIQQKQNCARARRVMDRVNTRIEDELQRQTSDIAMMERIYDILASQDQQAGRWMDAKRAETISSQKALEVNHVLLSKQRHAVADWSDAITDALDLRPWVNNPTLGISDEATRCFVTVLESLIPGADKSGSISLQEVAAHMPAINKLRVLPSVTDKQNAAKLHKCIMQWCKQQQS